MSSKNDDTWIPEGFVRVIGPNNEKYIMPEFMIPAIDQVYLADLKREKLNANNAQGIVSLLFGQMLCSGDIAIMHKPA